MFTRLFIILLLLLNPILNSNPNYKLNLFSSTNKTIVSLNTKIPIKIIAAIYNITKDTTLTKKLVAQVITESGDAAQSSLVVKYNNLFGFKYNPKYHRGYIELLTNEYDIEVGWIRIPQKFAIYTSYEECVRDRLRIKKLEIGTAPLYSKVLNSHYSKLYFTYTNSITYLYTNRYVRIL